MLLEYLSEWKPQVLCTMSHCLISLQICKSQRYLPRSVKGSRIELPSSQFPQKGERLSDFWTEGSCMWMNDDCQPEFSVHQFL